MIRIPNLISGTILSTIFWHNYHFEKRTSKDYKIMPWANGKGTTTELYVHPEGTNLVDSSAVWRISMATVTEDGTFSVFPDYHRIITVVEGNGFQLKGNGVAEIKQGVIHTFPGSEKIDCSLVKGPCLDFNIIFRKDKVDAKLELISLPKSDDQFSFHAEKNETVIVVCFKGKGQIIGNTKRTLNQYESIRFILQKGKKRSIILKALQPDSKFALVRIKGIIYSQPPFPEGV